MKKYKAYSAFIRTDPKQPTQYITSIQAMNMKNAYKFFKSIDPMVKHNDVRRSYSTLSLGATPVEVAHPELFGIVNH
jgi:hypothetical protein